MTKLITNEQGDEGRGKFHWLFLDRQVRARQRYDAVILETDHFVVLPSLGSLVAGWLLVVPKTPLSRIADLDVELRHELEALVDQCIDTVESKFGQAFLFEHGGKKGSKISCGVDQAHLHIVPLGFDLVQLATQSVHQPWSREDGLLMPYDVCPNEEYWYVANRDQTSSTSVVEEQSQLFRKLIARQVGQGHKWNYNEHPFYDQVDQTLKVMGVDG